MTSPNPPRPIHDKISKSNNNLDWPGVAGSENWKFERVSSSGLLLLDLVFLSWLWSLLTPTLSSRMGSLIQSCNEDFCRALWRTYFRGEDRYVSQNFAFLYKKILSSGWWAGGGLSKNLVKPWVQQLWCFIFLLILGRVLVTFFLVTGFARPENELLLS